MAAGDYNLNRPVCKIGNWLEDRKLVADGYAARVYGRDINNVETFERVAPNAKENSTLHAATTGRPGAAPVAHWRSMAQTQMQDATQASHRTGEGPRGLALAKSMEAEARDYVASLRPREERVEIGTETRSQYKQWDAGAYREAPLAASMRGKGSGMGTAGAGAAQALGSPGRRAAAPPVIDSADSLGVTADVAAYRAKSYLHDAPITCYSTRVAERIFPSTSARVGASAAAAGGAGGTLGGRSAPFSTPLQVGYKPHAGADDKGAFAPTTGVSGAVGGSAAATAGLGATLSASFSSSSLARGGGGLGGAAGVGRSTASLISRGNAGSELGLQALFVRFARRLRDRGVTLGSLLEQCMQAGVAAAAEEASYTGGEAAAAAAAEEAADRASYFGRGGDLLGSPDAGDLVIPGDAFRKAVHGLRLQLTDLDLQAVACACDATGAGEAVSLAVLRELLLGAGLS